MDEIIKTLLNFNFFDSLNEDEVIIVAKRARWKEIQRKTVFIEEGEDSEVVYFIVKGSAKVFKTTEDGEEINLSIVGPGDLIGEMSMIEGIPRSASVQTLQDLLALTISKADFLTILKSHPQIAIKILQSFSKRIRKADEKLEEVMTQNLDKRVFKALEILTKYFPNGEIALTQEELAPIIGATRPRITEALHKLEQENKILLSSHKISLV